MKKIFSVQTETNSWNDDLFNGTAVECANYCIDNGYVVDGKDARIALIWVDDKGIVLDMIDSLVEGDEDELLILANIADRALRSRLS